MGDFIFSTQPPTTSKSRIKDWYIYFVLIFENGMYQFFKIFGGILSLWLRS